MISDIAKAIMTRYAGSSLASALTGGMWLSFAKQDASYPYCVFEFISLNNDDTYTERIEEGRIQFAIWTNDLNRDTASTGLNNLVYLLRSLYDDASLSVSGWTCVHFTFQSERNISYNDEIIGAIVEYTFAITKSK